MISTDDAASRSAALASAPFTRPCRAVGFQGAGREIATWQVADLVRLFSCHNAWFLAGHQQTVAGQPDFPARHPRGNGRGVGRFDQGSRRMPRPRHCHLKDAAGGAG
jgi:hypothetical protein